MVLNEMVKGGHKNQISSSNNFISLDSPHRLDHIFQKTLHEKNVKNVGNQDSNEPEYISSSYCTYFLQTQLYLSVQKASQIGLEKKRKKALER